MKVTEGRITSRFGMRVHSITKVQQMHNGVDIAAPEGTPVYCPDAGQVVVCGFSPSAGNMVHVRCGGLTFIFMHLHGFSVNQSQMVSKGQRIGSVGNTGMSTGAHLHFEVRVNGIAVNPELYIEF
jgi:murein DD-endopeptidase MepM/ murein hydrolase activator NlpD